MRAIVYHGNKDVRYDPQYPEPTINHPKEVKIKIDYCGICCSDLDEYRDGPIFFSPDHQAISRKPFPQAMGHEMCGEIVELGSAVNANLKVGQKVVVESTGTCLDREYLELPEKKCLSCVQGAYNHCDHIGFYGLGFSDGGFADFCVVGEHHVIPYSEEDLPVEIAALTEPLAVSWHGVRVSNVTKDDSALVLGAGSIGLTTIIALKGHGVRNIIVSEPKESRRALAEKFHVQVFDPTPFNHDEKLLTKELLKLSPLGWGFSRIFDCSGKKETFDISLSALKTTGIATNVAFWAHNKQTVFPMDLTLHEKNLTSSLCYVREDFEEVIQAYRDGLIDPEEVRQIVTKVVALKDGFEEGFLQLINHKGKHIKVLVSPLPKI